MTLYDTLGGKKRCFWGDYVKIYANQAAVSVTSLITPVQIKQYKHVYADGLYFKRKAVCLINLKWERKKIEAGEGMPVYSCYNIS